MTDTAWVGSYLGAGVRAGVLHFAPTLTDRLDGLTFPMQFRGTWIRVSISGDELTVHTLAEGFSRPVRIGIGDEVRELTAGQEWVAPLRRQRDLPEGSDHTGERSDRVDTRL